MMPKFNKPMKEHLEARGCAWESQYSSHEAMVTSVLSQWKTQLSWEWRIAASNLGFAKNLQCDFE